MEGKRRDITDSETVLERGEYGKHYFDDQWYCVTPNGLYGCLGSHDVTEHDDGTITVSPSILIQYYNGTNWHGYLERGVWI